jgi:hypothetical protein
MFRLHCKSVGVPVALASGDEQKSALEVLTRWADDLKADGVRLPEFDKTFQQHRAIQAKVENEATKVAGKLAKSAAATVGRNSRQHLASQASVRCWASWAGWAPRRWWTGCAAFSPGPILTCCSTLRRN